jgi:hypothetical protein
MKIKKKSSQLISPEIKRLVPLRFRVSKNYKKMALPVGRTWERIYKGLLSTPKTG